MAPRVSPLSILIDSSPHRFTKHLRARARGGGGRGLKPCIFPLSTDRIFTVTCFPVCSPVPSAVFATEYTMNNFSLHNHREHTLALQSCVGHSVRRLSHPVRVSSYVKLFFLSRRFVLANNISAATTFRASYMNEHPERRSFAPRTLTASWNNFSAGSPPWVSKRRQLRRLSGVWSVHVVFPFFGWLYTACSVVGYVRTRLIPFLYFVDCNDCYHTPWSSQTTTRLFVTALSLTFAEDKRAFDGGYSCFFSNPETGASDTCRGNAGPARDYVEPPHPLCAASFWDSPYLIINRSYCCSLLLGPPTDLSLRIFLLHKQCVAVVQRAGRDRGTL